VSISTPKAQPGSPPVTTVSLYNTDPNDWNDPYDPLGNRLLEQADSAAQGGTAQIERQLAPGTYYVAVSGSGNHYFHPYLADSGYAGATGNYGLLLTATDLGLSPSDGPIVLAADPQPGAKLDRSPFLIRVDLSEPLDPNTVVAGGTVQLITNLNGTFGDGNDQPVSLASANLNSAGNELLIAPAAPLPPGYYEVVLAGDRNANTQVLADFNATSLGTDGSHPAGADFSYAFQITGNEGRVVNGSNNTATPDDTPANSHQLGDVTKAGLLQVAGAIGDDSTDPNGFDGADVDLYHFQVNGSGRFALTAEVFAVRIGSPLAPGLSLFQVDPTTGQLKLLSSNAGSLNTAVATNGSRPLHSDPVLSTGLQPGDYYLAVSNHFNVPDPVNSLPGTNGVFDPTISHSGQNGGPTGDYVLNLQVQPTTQQPPQVLAVTPNNGATLNAPPVQLTVQFSEPVNLPQLAAEEPVVENGQPVSDTCVAVYVEGSNGIKYYPRLQSYDASTNQATFMMLDRLGTDAYQLHLLSGAFGLAGVGGELVGNDASGDYVSSFTVKAPALGTKTNPLLLSDQEPNNSLPQAQNLGVLFPHDLQKPNQVTLQRDFTQSPASAPADQADYYRFQIVEAGSYIFNIASTGLPSGAKVTLLDITGAPVRVATQPRGLGFSADLQPGMYFLCIGDWQTTQAAGVKYTVGIKLGSTFDNPVPLTVGPAPAISLQLVTNAPPNPPPQGVSVSLPPSSPSVVPSTTSTGTSPGATNGSTGTLASTTPGSPTSATQPPTQGAPAASQGATAPATANAPSSPPLPSASVALLVNLLVPTGANTAALAPTAFRGNLNRPAESINLPSGVWLTLGAGPVGGIKDSVPAEPSPSADRILVRLPDLSGVRQLQTETTAFARIESGANRVDLPVADPATSAETTDEGPAKPIDSEQAQGSSGRLSYAASASIEVPETLRQLVSRSYAGALDAFFSLARWVEEQPLGTPQSVSLPQTISTEAEPENQERPDSATPLDTARAPNVGDSVLAIGLAALTALAMARPEMRRTPGTREKVVGGEW
jgi:hypothetical protein